MYISKIVIERVNDPLVKKHYKKFKIKSIQLEDSEVGFAPHAVHRYDIMTDIVVKSKRHIITYNIGSIDVDKKSLDVRKIEIQSERFFIDKYMDIHVGDIITDKQIRKITKIIKDTYESLTII